MIKKNKDSGFSQLILRNINKAIDETHISKAEIARRLGVNYSTLWKVLHGKLRLKPEHIAEIAHMTYRTPNDFFYCND
ncbi:MAG: helix-turn-helix transcriptional regulator [Synergistaceae bacterium]|nr:helix-turn-helix transcriptional regulator [Synergistaceae bacterium]